MKEVFNKATIGIRHIKTDSYIHGNLLYCDKSQLRTLNLDSSKGHTVAGKPNVNDYREGIGRDARFNIITSFHAINVTHVLVVDSGNHCLRTVDRQTNQTATLFGTCSDLGDVDGFYSKAHFYNPTSLALGNDRKLYLSDTFNQAIRKIDLTNGKVSTFITFRDIKPWMAFIPPQHNMMYFTYLTDLYRISLNGSHGPPVKLTRSSRGGYMDGYLNQALFSILRDIVALDPDTIIVSESSMRLRVINLVENTTSSICNGARGSNSGPIHHCSLCIPHSLFLHRVDQFHQLLYIGTAEGLHVLPVTHLTAVNEKEKADKTTVTNFNFKTTAAYSSKVTSTTRTNTSNEISSTTVSEQKHSTENRSTNVIFNTTRSTYTFKSVWNSTGDDSIKTTLETNQTTTPNLSTRDNKTFLSSIQLGNGTTTGEYHNMFPFVFPKSTKKIGGRTHLDKSSQRNPNQSTPSSSFSPSMYQFILVLSL